MSALLSNCIYTFVCSMVPIIELRGAIPLGYGLGLPVWLNYIICVVGNMLPVPVILLFVRAVLNWMKNTKHLRKIAEWVEAKAQKHSAKVMKYTTFGLLLFVAIPLPGTGAWTGALVAALFDIKMKYSLSSIAAGVMIAGFIMCGACYGFLGFLGFLLG